MTVESVCDDETDDDGDGVTDCADSDCANDQACAAPPLDVTDPQDLPGPDGDPSLDIQGVDVTVEGTTVTGEVFFHGPWPPATTFYSWFVEVAYTANGTQIGTITTQRHDGTASTYGTGVPNNAITVTDGAKSVKLVVTGVATAPTHFAVQAGIQKTNPGNRVVDSVPSTAIPN